MRADIVYRYDTVKQLLLNQFAREGDKSMGSFSAVEAFVDNLVRENATKYLDRYILHIDDVDDFDQYKLASLMLMADKQHGDEWSWLTEYEHRDAIFNELIRYMTSRSLDDLYHFTNVLMKHLLIAYKPRMLSIIEDRTDVVFHEDRASRRN